MTPLLGVKRKSPQFGVFRLLAAECQGELMRVNKAQDVRWVLCNKKRFGLRPEPLEQYVYSLGLSQTAERVFWTHWDIGVRRGDFTSELSLQEVATRCHCDVSGVTRAYRRLQKCGLLR